MMKHVCRLSHRRAVMTVGDKMTSPRAIESCRVAFFARVMMDK